MSDEGFFARWSRRKEAVREGQAVEAEPAVEQEAKGHEPPPQPSPGGGGSEAPPPPTLEDVERLTPESDFARFVARDVPADVKNAAMKKLFADPHFNVMDGLDTYIDDYNKPDPLPAEMLKKLASAEFMGLFREVADEEAAESVAQSATGEPAVMPPDTHADPDLRLQQDDAPGPEGPGEGPR
jgi:hypothetical protein